MRNISFFETQRQTKNRTKTVTRRIGWQFLKPGDLLQGVVKGQGLKKGEKIQKLDVIRVLDVRREMLFTISAEDVVKEGFPEMTPQEFIELFKKINKLKTHREKVTRIEFEYVD